jgi:hypothetical protein
LNLEKAWFATEASGRYFNVVETLLNVEFNDVPMPFTAATITIESPAAIRQYSIAVAPESSARNWRAFANMNSKMRLYG